MDHKHRKRSFSELLHVTEPRESYPKLSWSEPSSPLDAIRVPHCQELSKQEPLDICVGASTHNDPRNNDSGKCGNKPEPHFEGENANVACAVTAPSRSGEDAIDIVGDGENFMGELFEEKIDRESATSECQPSPEHLKFSDSIQVSKTTYKKLKASGEEELPSVISDMGCSFSLISKHTRTVQVRGISQDAVHEVCRLLRLRPPSLPLTHFVSVRLTHPHIKEAFQVFRSRVRELALQQREEVVGRTEPSSYDADGSEVSVHGMKLPREMKFKPDAEKNVEIQREAPAEMQLCSEIPNSSLVSELTVKQPEDEGNAKNVPVECKASGNNLMVLKEDQMRQSLDVTDKASNAQEKEIKMTAQEGVELTGVQDLSGFQNKSEVIPEEPKKVAVTAQKRNVLVETPLTSALPDSVFQRPEKLHLTVTMLSLSSEKDQRRAVDIIADCVNSLSVFSPLRFRLRGLDVFGTRQRSQVLYARTEPSEPLQQLADLVHARLYAAGLAKRQQGSVKLHVTLMNATFVQRAGRKWRGYRGFNGGAILESMSETDLGEVVVDRLEVSSLWEKGEDGFYSCAGKVMLADPATGYQLSSDVLDSGKKHREEIVTEPGNIAPVIGSVSPSPLVKPQSCGGTIEHQLHRCLS